MKQFLNAALYFVAFMIIQIAVQLAALLICRQLSLEQSGTSVALTSMIGSALTIALFMWRKWSPFSREYMQRRQWNVLVWTALMALGIMAPMQLLNDLTGAQLPKAQKLLFEQLLGSNWAFLAVVVLVPIAEEMVFRGAVLRSLLNHFGRKGHWWAIGFSAVLFGVAHGNMAQFVNAFIMGLVLGWLYWRSGSIVPGFVFHAVNNGITVYLFRFLPAMNDMTLTQFFGNDWMRLSLFLLCSLCVLVPSWWQVKERI